MSCWYFDDRVRLSYGKESFAAEGVRLYSDGEQVRVVTRYDAVTQVIMAKGTAYVGVEVSHGISLGIGAASAGDIAAELTRRLGGP